MDDLLSGTREVLAGRPPRRPEALLHPLAFNLFPQVDVFGSQGYTKEEDKMLFETRKVLGLPELPVEATCVRVPVLRCHSESVGVELRSPATVADAVTAFRGGKGLAVVDEPEERLYPQPVTFSGRDEVGVGRIRQSRVFSPGLAFWLVGDQLRKGAALNAVQIAELLLLGGRPG
jgi:aspartate-semialdehyde dehydrogenase